MGYGFTIEERTENALSELRKEIPGIEISEYEEMKYHCSFKTGGPVRAFITPKNITEMTDVISILSKNSLIPYFLGNGTNVVFPDEGEKKLTVISTDKLQNICLLSEGLLYADAGVSLSKLAGFAYENSLKGLEFASGIPGTVGGGVIMNAGAYGGELKDVIDSVKLFCLPDQKFCEMSNEQCCFGYRKSIFQSVSGYAVLGAAFRLQKGSREDISAKMRELNGRRREKQPLDLPSAGSAFRRPEGYYAAALIEESGLKGYSIGGACVSGKHAGFIVNNGRATSSDLKDLISYVRNTVYEKKLVRLEPEIILLPENYVPEGTEE
ncbi:MAG: UDP-N-acetylmuramate dehydrogenase [Eubacteriales bacterium]|nr:UDP-N-acetylmuramate dehydrogenase [Eubacteriales bacterium]